MIGMQAVQRPRARGGQDGGRRRLMGPAAAATWAAAAGCVSLLLLAGADQAAGNQMKGAVASRALAALSYGSSPYSERIGGRRAFDQAKAMATDATGATYVLGTWRLYVHLVGWKDVYKVDRFTPQNVQGLLRPCTSPEAHRLDISKCPSPSTHTQATSGARC